MSDPSQSLCVSLVEACVLLDAHGSALLVAGALDAALLPSLAPFCFVGDMASSGASVWRWRAHSFGLTSASGALRHCAALLFPARLLDASVPLSVPLAHADDCDDDHNSPTTSSSSASSSLWCALVLVSPVEAQAQLLWLARWLLCSYLAARAPPPSPISSSLSQCASALSSCASLLVSTCTVPLLSVADACVLRLALPPLPSPSSALTVALNAALTALLPTCPRVSLQGAHSSFTLLLPSLSASPLSSLPSLDVHVCLQLSALPVRLTAALWIALLLERRLVLTSRSLTRAADTLSALCALLSPATWMHARVPLLPRALADALHAPTPYIMALSHTQAHSLAPELDADVTLADLDTHTLYRGGSTAPLEENSLLNEWRVPTVLVDALCTRLQECQTQDVLALDDASLPSISSREDPARAYVHHARTRSNERYQVAFALFWRDLVQLCWAGDLTRAFALHEPGVHVDSSPSSTFPSSTSSSSSSSSPALSSELLSFRAAVSASTAWEQLALSVRGLEGQPPPPLLAYLSARDLPSAHVELTRALSSTLKLNAAVDLSALDASSCVASLMVRLWRVLSSRVLDAASALTALRLLALLHVERPSLPLVHHAPLYARLFAAYRSERISSEQFGAHVSSMWGAWSQSSLRSRVLSEARTRAQRLRLSSLRRSLAHTQALTHAHARTKPQPLNTLAHELTQALTTLHTVSVDALPTSARVHVDAVTAWLVRVGLAVPECEGDAPLLRLVRALQSSSPSSSSDGDTLPRVHVDRFCSLVCARAQAVSADGQCLLRVRVTHIAGKGARAQGELSVSAQSVSFVCAESPTRTWTRRWSELRLLEAHALTVLFTPLPCVRLAGHGVSHVDTLCFSSERSRSLCLLVALELWHAHALARELDDAAPLVHAALAAVTAHALSTLVPAQQDLDRASLALHASPRQELELVQRIQQAGVLNQLEDALQEEDQEELKGDGAEEEGDLVGVVVVLVSRAVQLLYTHTSTATSNSSTGVVSSAAALSRVRSGSAPVRVASASSSSAAVGVGVERVDWSRLCSSRAYASLCASVSRLASVRASASALSSATRGAFLLNLHALLLLHACFVARAAPRSLWEWRLFARFASYNVGGLPFTLELMRRLLRGRGATEPAVACSLDFDERNDPRAPWLLATRDARVHFALGVGLSAWSPALRIVAAHNWDEHLEAAARDYCAAYATLNDADAHARLVLPELLAWYVDDFSRDNSDTKEDAVRRSTQETTKEQKAESVAWLLRWLPEERQRELARIVDEPDFELHFDHDWSLAPRVMRSHQQ